MEIIAMQTVFRVRPSKAKIKTQPSGGSSSAVRPRRTHTKSRAGCQNCKRRRVKCDEDREHGCRNCRQHGVDCDYLTGVGEALTVKSTGSSSTSSSSTGGSSTGISNMTSIQTPSSVITPQSNESVEADTTKALIRPSRPNAKLYPSMCYVSPFIFQAPDDIVPVLQTMSYFELFTCSTVTSTAGLDIFKDSILALSHHRDYLMHAMLGMAAAHLSEVDAIANDPCQIIRFRKTESYHWQQAIRLYRAELGNEVSLDHIDSLISTCMLLGIHAMYMANPDEKKVGHSNLKESHTDVFSFVDTPKAERRAKLGWLVVPLGFRVVMQRIARYITASAWFDLFQMSTPTDDGWRVNLESASGIYAAFLDLCDVKDNTSTNVFRDPLQNLFAILHIERVTMRDFAHLAAFTRVFRGEILDLLVERDSRVLMIMLYWLTLFDALDLWWGKVRFATEAHAIISFLEHDPNPKVQQMLQLPKIAFGRLRKASASSIPATDAAMPDELSQGLATREDVLSVDRSHILENFDPLNGRAGARQGDFQSYDAVGQTRAISYSPRTKHGWM